MMYKGEISVTVDAIAFAAVIFIFVMCGDMIHVGGYAHASRSARNIPGKTSVLLICLGKFERPVPTMNAPAFLPR